MKLNRTYPVLALLAVLAVAGCGSSSKSSSTASTPATTSTPATSSTPSSAGGSNLKLSADPGGALKFDKSSLSAKAGNVSITMSNPSCVAHGVAIEGNGVSKTGSIVNQGASSTVTASLKPGKYTFFCPVPGHRQAGMQGTLTVK